MPRVVVPPLHRVGPGFRPLGRDVFPVELITPGEQPVYFLDAAAAGVDAQDRAAAAVLAEVKRLFGQRDQLPQRLAELDVADVEAVGDDLLAVGGDDATELPPVANALGREVALGGEPRPLAARQPGHIDAEQLPTPPIVMAEGVTMAAEDEVNGALHLSDVLCCAGVQSLLDDRLLGA